VKRSDLEHIVRAAAGVAAKAKKAAGRDKDYAFATALLKASLLQPAILELRILPVEEFVKQRIREWLTGNRRA